MNTMNKLIQATKKQICTLLSVVLMLSGLPVNLSAANASAAKTVPADKSVTKKRRKYSKLKKAVAAAPKVITAAVPAATATPKTITSSATTSTAIPAATTTSSGIHLLTSAIVEKGPLLGATGDTPAAAPTAPVVQGLAYTCSTGGTNASCTGNVATCGTGTCKTTNYAGKAIEIVKYDITTCCTDFCTCYGASFNIVDANCIPNCKQYYENFSAYVANQVQVAGTNQLNKLANTSCTDSDNFNSHYSDLNNLLTALAWANNKVLEATVTSKGTISMQQSETTATAINSYFASRKCASDLDCIVDPNIVSAQVCTSYMTSDGTFNNSCNNFDPVTLLGKCVITQGSCKTDHDCPSYGCPIGNAACPAGAPCPELQDLHCNLTSGTCQTSVGASCASSTNICTGGVCAITSEACTTDADCSTANTCGTSGTCNLSGDTCSATTPCPKIQGCTLSDGVTPNSDLACISGVCTLVKVGIACSPDANGADYNSCGITGGLSCQIDGRPTSIAGSNICLLSLVTTAGPQQPAITDISSDSCATNKNCGCVVSGNCPSFGITVAGTGSAAVLTNSFPGAGKSGAWEANNPLLDPNNSPPSYTFDPSDPNWAPIINAVQIIVTANTSSQAVGVIQTTTTTEGFACGLGQNYSDDVSFNKQTVQCQASAAGDAGINILFDKITAAANLTNPSTFNVNGAAPAGYSATYFNNFANNYCGAANTPTCGIRADPAYTSNAVSVPDMAVPDACCPDSNNPGTYSCQLNNANGNTIACTPGVALSANGCPDVCLYSGSITTPCDPSTPVQVTLNDIPVAGKCASPTFGSFVTSGSGNYASPYGAIMPPPAGNIGVPSTVVIIDCLKPANEPNGLADHIPNLGISLKHPYGGPCPTGDPTAYQACVSYTSGPWAGMTCCDASSNSCTTTCSPNAAVTGNTCSAAGVCIVTGDVCGGTNPPCPTFTGIDPSNGAAGTLIMQGSCVGQPCAMPGIFDSTQDNPIPGGLTNTNALCCNGTVCDSTTFTCKYAQTATACPSTNSDASACQTADGTNSAILCASQCAYVAGATTLTCNPPAANGCDCWKIPCKNAQGELDDTMCNVSYNGATYGCLNTYCSIDGVCQPAGGSTVANTMPSGTGVAYDATFNGICGVVMDKVYTYLPTLYNQDLKVATVYAQTIDEIYQKLDLADALKNVQFDANITCYNNGVEVDICDPTTNNSAPIIADINAYIYTLQALILTKLNNVSSPIDPNYKANTCDTATNTCPLGGPCPCTNLYTPIITAINNNESTATINTAIAAFLQPSMTALKAAATAATPSVVPAAGQPYLPFIATYSIQNPSGVPAPGTGQPYLANGPDAPVPVNYSALAILPSLSIGQATTATMFNEGMACPNANCTITNNPEDCACTFFNELVAPCKTAIMSLGYIKTTYDTLLNTTLKSSDYGYSIVPNYQSQADLTKISNASNEMLIDYLIYQAYRTWLGTDSGIFTAGGSCPQMNAPAPVQPESAAAYRAACMGLVMSGLFAGPIVLDILKSPYHLYEWFQKRSAAKAEAKAKVKAEAEAKKSSVQDDPADTPAREANLQSVRDQAAKDFQATKAKITAKESRVKGANDAQTAEAAEGNTGRPADMAGADPKVPGAVTAETVKPGALEMTPVERAQLKMNIRSQGPVSDESMAKFEADIKANTVSVAEESVIDEVAEAGETTAAAAEADIKASSSEGSIDDFDGE